ncbi:MAG: hypothetical protein V1790_01810 [Planctomycetota bacterium]
MSSIPQSDLPQPDREARTSADDPPTIEDAYAAEDTATDAVVEEDDPRTADFASRSLEGPAIEPDADTLECILEPLSPAGGSDEPTEGQTSRPRREGPGGSEGRVGGSQDALLADSAVALPQAVSEDQGASDMAAAAPIAHPEQTGDWANELSPHRVAVELRRIESEVRALLEERDPKRKRKLSGTSRWQELEEDIVSWRFSGRFNEDTLRRAQELIARRHHLFNRLRFLASTRPTWNS